MLRPTENDIAQAKAANGEKNVHMLEAREHDVAVLVKKPGRAQYRMFRENIADDTRKAHAPENLLLGCLVWPDRKTFEAQLDELPAVGDSLSGDLLKLAGLTRDTEKKTV